MKGVYEASPPEVYYMCTFLSMPKGVVEVSFSWSGDVTLLILVVVFTDYLRS